MEDIMMNPGGGGVTADKSFEIVRTWHRFAKSESKNSPSSSVNKIKSVIENEAIANNHSTTSTNNKNQSTAKIVSTTEGLAALPLKEKNSTTENKSTF